VLNEQLEKTCIKLNTKYSKYIKFRKLTAIALLSLLTIVVATLLLIPEDQTVYDRPEISYPGGIGTLISGIISAYYIKKTSKTKLTGYKKYMAITYRAYQNLKQYQKNEDEDFLDAAENELDSLVTDLTLFWGDFEQSDPSFQSLKKHVNEFITFIDLRLIPVLDSSKEIDYEEFYTALQMILEAFESNNFNKIIDVNNYIATKYEEQLEEEKPLIEKIKEHQNLTKILVSFLIIGVAGGISFGARLAVNADNESFVTWWIMISVGFVAIYLWRSQK